jgi:maleylpyruvate isomerase
VSAPVRLHNYFRSSASWRVRIALGWKNIRYEYVPVSLVHEGGEHLREAYRAVNPLQAVPTLEIDGLRLSESLAICEYLEETRPEPPLLPKNPAERAQARRIAEAVNAGIQPLQNLRVLRKLEADFHVGAAGTKAWAAHFNAVGLAGVEALCGSSAGRFCVGDAVSIADLCLVPQLFGARRFGVDVGAFPTLLRVEAALAVLPAFAEAVPARQPDCPPDQR